MRLQALYDRALWWRQRRDTLEQEEAPVEEWQDAHDRFERALKAFNETAMRIAHLSTYQPKRRAK